MAGSNKSFPFIGKLSLHSRGKDGARLERVVKEDLRGARAVKGFPGNLSLKWFAHFNSLSRLLPRSTWHRGRPREDAEPSREAATKREGKLGGESAWLQDLRRMQTCAGNSHVILELMLVPQI